MSHSEALLCAGGIVALNALSGLMINQFIFFGCYNGMKMRVAVCSVIYRKVSSHCALVYVDFEHCPCVHIFSYYAPF